MDKNPVRQTYEGIHALGGGKPRLGSLKLRDYHIVFCEDPPAAAKSSDASKKIEGRQIWISYHIIAQCTIRPTLPISGVPSSIRLRCRDFTFVCFNFDDAQQAREAFEFIRGRTARLGSIEKLFAFAEKPSVKGINGWEIYDPKVEFRRQGISEKSADKGWRISTINKDYVFSPTYPSLLAVPSKISDNTLKYAGQFRSRARIPVLTYLHPINNCTITRSSQPFVGLRGKRSIQDERLVGACFSAITDYPDASSASPEASPPTSQTDVPVDGIDAELSDTERLEDEFIAGNTIYDEKTGRRLIFGAQQHNLIVDARPAINSYAMQAIGMGSENMDYYKFAKKVFLSIDNIHVMRDSLNKVIDAIKDADISPFPPNRDLLAKSGWIKHITGILDGSAIIARQVGIQHSHVLIHCSDGWDRTSQLSAMAQLMLDPYYRTIDGFIVLVEKDWLSFGHMFQMRSGFLNHDKWFVVQNDALAGQTIQPGDGEGGRNDAIENALASAKRFFNKNLGQSKDEDEELDSVVDETKQATAPVTENQATRPKDISPVFHQFLDATYQLLRQHPTRFEFNERFLRRLLYHLYSCQYGTFLYNNDRQRRDAHVQERTSSVWDYFLSQRQMFTNDQYDATVDDHTKGRERLIFPRLGEVRWWHQVFNRTDDEMNGTLNAAAATAERVAAYAAAAGSSPSSSTPNLLSHAGTPPPSSPQPPGMPTSKSVLLGVESAHAALTPEPRVSGTPPSFQKSASTGTSEAFASLREGIAGLGIGRGILGGGGGSGGSGSGSTTAAAAGGGGGVAVGRSSRESTSGAAAGDDDGGVDANAGGQELTTMAE